MRKNARVGIVHAWLIVFWESAWVEDVLFEYVFENVAHIGLFAQSM